MSVDRILDAGACAQEPQHGPSIAKVPYPDKLFVTKDDAQRIKAEIDKLNTVRLGTYAGEGGATVGGPIGHLGPLGTSSNQASVRSEPLSLGGQHAIDIERQLCQTFQHGLIIKVKSLEQQRWNLERQREALNSRIERLTLLIRDLD